jgi:hypothetical protein
VVGRKRNNPERKKPYYDEKDKAALRLMRKLREVVSHFSYRILAGSPHPPTMIDKKEHERRQKKDKKKEKEN